MNAMEIWNRLKQVPPTALKSIGAGRLRGKSDINPQARYQLLTEQFGLCGIGWKFTVDRLWTEPAPSGEVFAFALVSLFVRNGEAWSDAIPGVGGNFLIEQESKGLHANDEAFKMAVTDALGTAAKMVGVAADVYLGNWDGAKYVNQRVSEPKPPVVPPSAKPTDDWDSLPMATKRERVLAQVKAVRQIANSVEAMKRLHAIITHPKATGLDQIGIDLVASEALAIETELRETQQVAK